MILQGPDIQPEPSEKVRSPENDVEYVSDCFFFIQKNAKRVFQSSKRLFQNLDEQNKGLTLRTSAIIYFRGNMSNKKKFNVDNLFDRKGIHVGKQEKVSH